VATRLRAAIKIADAGSSPIRNHCCCDVLGPPVKAPRQSSRGGAPGSGTIPQRSVTAKRSGPDLFLAYAPAAGNSRRRPRPPPTGSGPAAYGRAAQRRLSPNCRSWTVWEAKDQKCERRTPRAALRDDWKLRLEKFIQPSGYLLSALAYPLHRRISQAVLGGHVSRAKRCQARSSSRRESRAKIECRVSNAGHPRSTV
jgi:hypothetical protein